jgi:hypothetical protein
MPIVDKLRAWIRAKGGSVAGADTIEGAVKELARLDTAEADADSNDNNDTEPTG